MCHVVTAAPAAIVIGRFSVPLHTLQRPVLLGDLLLQHSLGRMALQRKQFCGKQRLQRLHWLQLLHCSSLLTVLMLRLATDFDYCCYAAVQHNVFALVMKKRFFSGFADRLWLTSNPEAADCPSIPLRARIGTTFY
jgi:hypothetical protein